MLTPWHMTLRVRVWERERACMSKCLQCDDPLHVVSSQSHCCSVSHISSTVSFHTECEILIEILTMNQSQAQFNILLNTLSRCDKDPGKYGNIKHFISQHIVMQLTPSSLLIVGQSHLWLLSFPVFAGSLLDFLKEGDGKFLKLVLLVDMAAKVRRTKHTCMFMLPSICPSDSWYDKISQEHLEGSFTRVAVTSERKCFALWTRYLRNAFRESLQIWYKCSLALKDELIRICWSKVKVTLERLQGIPSHFAQLSLEPKEEVIRFQYLI